MTNDQLLRHQSISPFLFGPHEVTILIFGQIWWNHFGFIEILQPITTEGILSGNTFLRVKCEHSIKKIQCFWWEITILFPFKRVEIILFWFQL